MIDMTSSMSVVVAQHFGSGSKEKTRKAIASRIVLITVISVLVTAGGIWHSHFHLCGTELW